MTDWNPKVKKYIAALTAKLMMFLSGQLRIKAESLKQLNVGYDVATDSFTFPEVDGHGVATGIMCRTKDSGTKKMMAGGHRGIYVPNNFNSLGGPILVPEGASDVAAVLGFDIAVVGRPSATGGIDDLAEFLAGYVDRQIIIVGDNDEKPDGKWPGRTGAIKTAKALANCLDVDVYWTLPPSIAKDVRGWITGPERPETKDAILGCLTAAMEAMSPEPPVAVGDHYDELFVFSNFDFEDGKPKPVGLTAPNILAQLVSESGGFPRCCGGSYLFVELADNQLLFIRKDSELFAWIDGFAMVDWRIGPDKISQQRFFRYCLQSCERFDAIQKFPHVPEIAGNYYCHPQLMDELTGKLEEFLDFFCPLSPDDREFIKALVLTLIWGGPSGGRPVYVITGPDDDAEGGRGIGKSIFLQAMGALVGGTLEFTIGDDFNKLKSRILSPTAAGFRVAAIDNIKTHRFSWAEFEGIVTARTISGHDYYVGEGQRSNDLIWLLSFNGASVSKDIAQRTVVIKLARPEPSAKWVESLFDFIEEHRWDIFSDARILLQG